MDHPDAGAYRAQSAWWYLPGLHAQHLDLALTSAQGRGHDAQQCGFAGARGPDDRDPRAAFDRKPNAAQRALPIGMHQAERIQRDGDWP